MNVHWERNTNAKCDCTILNLTWMGKVPEELPEDEGWKLNRHNYYQEGWLATGNVRGIVGVTFTSSHCKRGADAPLRTNYNLRGHHSQVMLVKWNEPYQKLASCDASGIIFVWIKYEGRWSVELINDRNTPVTNFAWSHDGRMALICYRDGFVLVGSVAGQRYWSSMLNLPCTITCGVWTPDDQQVYFGTSSGQLIVMDVNGAMVSQVTVGGGRGITAMAWSCEKFKMDEGDDGDRSSMMHLDGRHYVIAVALESGTILYLRRFDDPLPVQLETGLQTGMPTGLHMEWSNAGELLAVAGYDPKQSVVKAGHPPYFRNVVKFYTDSGVLLYVIHIPCTKWPVTALTWGHNDKRLFVATGPQVHIAWVCRRIPSLSHLCRLKIHGALQRGEQQLQHLPLPPRVQHLISSLFAQTIRCCVPEHCPLRDFVSRPPRGHVRLHCTMIRHDDATSSSGTSYTLYLEYLGGLVPLLKGKRTSKIRPEFVIFDPRHDINTADDDPRLGPSGPLCSWAYGSLGSGLPDDDAESDSSTEDGGCVSPRMGRRRTHHPGHRGPGSRHFRSRYAPRSTPAELVYRDSLSEGEALTQVTSNIWGTRFKVVGLKGPGMPAVLGQITYKTSLLHLQPRQMTLCMTELRDESSPPIIFGLAPPKMLNPKARSPAATAVAIAAAATAAGAAAAAVEEAAVAGAEAAQGGRAGAAAAAAGTQPRTPRAVTEGQAPYLFSNTQRHRFESTAAALAAAHAQQAIAHAHAQQAQQAQAQADPPAAPQPQAAPPQSRTPSQRGSSQRSGSTSQRPSQRSSPHRSRSGMTSAMPALARAESYNDDEFPQVTQIQVQAQVLAEGSGAQRTPALQSPRIGVAPVLVSTPVPASDYDNVQRVKANQNQLYQFGLKQGGCRPSVEAHVNAPLEAAAGQAARMPCESAASPRPPGHLYQLKSCHTQPADATPAGVEEMRIPVFSIPSELNKIADLNDPDAILPDLIIPDVNIEDLNIPAFMDEPEPPDDQGSAALAAVLNFIDDEVGEVRIGPARSVSRSVSVGFLNEVAVGVQPRKRLVLTNRRRGHGDDAEDADKEDGDRRSCSKSMSMDAFPGYNRTLHANYLGPVLSSTIEDDDTSPARSRRPSPSRPATPAPVHQPQVQPQPRSQPQPRARPARHQADDDIRVLAEPLFVNLPAEKDKASPESPPDDTDVESSDSSSPFAPLVAAEVPVKPKKKRTLFDSLNARDVMTLVDWPRRRMRRNKRKDDTEAILLDQDSDADSRHSTPASPSRQPHSTPASPAASKKTPKRTLSSSPIRQRILNSPLLRRRRRNRSEADGESGDEAGLVAAIGAQQYSTLESFQKAQLRQKLKQKKKNKGKECSEDSDDSSQPRQLQFIMHNKAPMWNENSQVYQLDFGGRVTQESAKNFQIEFLNKQVMQFGRIDANAYTLDFQYPFSALQAFAVALANITQRLK